ncbi:uncharacterized protein LOC118431590 [Branchiostoma floridae]|uniref:Uncharacterized protein LOC118431590 n=1 Tax=Branchiostoma floridae TaxID=7739 RepID=A0A9J7MGE0_BRAFL|nr:uncharacterized protein LOC118431590 [Branchiostoma floridae]
MYRQKARRRYKNKVEVLYKCKEGDLLEFERVGYSHWGVYVGDYNVIHRTEDNGTARIREDSFWTVVGDDKAKINNSFDGTMTAMPGWKVVERARSKLGRTGYNTLFRNCEHFATWCRYGKAVSIQSITVATVSTGLTVAGVATGNPIMAGIGLGIGALTAVTSMFSKMASNYKSEISPEVRRHSEDVLSKCQEGDLLKFPREGYSHWAVYIGGEKVIHLSGKSDSVMKSISNSPSVFSTLLGVTDLGKVMEDSFWNVVGDSRVMMSNYLDATKYVRSGEEILERARLRLGEVGYNPLWENCEHFATWCRYGEKQSEQAETAKALLVGAGVGVVTIAVGFGAWALWPSSKKATREEKK